MKKYAFLAVVLVLGTISLRLSAQQLQFGVQYSVGAQAYQHSYNAAGYATNGYGYNQQPVRVVLVQYIDACGYQRSCPTQYARNASYIDGNYCYYRNQYGEYQYYELPRGYRANRGYQNQRSYYGAGNSQYARGSQYSYGNNYNRAPVNHYAVLDGLSDRPGVRRASAAAVFGY